MSERIYLAIDLKSFYASVECRERQLDPMTTHLVVADKSRTEKNHLPGGIPLSEGLRDPGAGTALSGCAEGPGDQRRPAAAGAGASISRNLLP